jgi:hypothetical protein
MNSVTYHLDLDPVNPWYAPRFIGVDEDQNGTTIFFHL